MAAFLLGVPGKLKTLLGRISADRAARLDEVTATRMGRLDTNVASRATQASVSTALTDLTTLQERLTAARGSNLDYLDAPLSAIPTSPIRSVQRGHGSTGGSSVEIAIAAVNTSRSVVHVQGGNATSNPSSAERQTVASGVITKAYFVDASTLRIERGAAQDSFNYSWQVIEYE